jgi:cytochrome c551/c552
MKEARMNMVRLGLVLSSAIPLAHAAYTGDGAQLTQSKGCIMCHDVSQKKVGPSFSTIAAQYKGKPGAAATLEAKLKNGTGHPKIDATDAELQQLIGYVLGTQ